MSPKAAGEISFRWGRKTLRFEVLHTGNFVRCDGNEYHNPETVEYDFAQMAESGLNAIRTYTVPPRWHLDVATATVLRVMIGLPWEQHVTFSR